MAVARRCAARRGDRPLTVARNIIRELRALGARLERDGDRLILRAGSRPIPQPLVQQARDAKRDILALLGPPGTLSPPNGDAISPTSKNPVAVLAKTCPESRENASDLLTPPVGGLSGGLSLTWPIGGGVSDFGSSK